MPGGGHGGHLEEPVLLVEETPCDFLGIRFMDAGDVTFTVDKKLSTARLTGTRVVGNPGASATPPVDMTWTGFGEVSQSLWYEKGYIGAMGFTDDADDASSGSIAKTRSYERTTSR